VIDVAAREENQGMLERYDAANPLALERLIAAGVEVRRFPDDVLQAAWRESQALLEEQARRHPAFQRIYEPWRAFREKSFRYFNGVEQAYAGFAFGQAR
jgi:TRAP-type mannitol/chloroaromatic compound transport system substrate-binding protein